MTEAIKSHVYDKEFLIVKKFAGGGEGIIWETDDPRVLVKQFEPALISDDPGRQQILREKAERAYKAFCAVNKGHQAELSSLPREYVTFRGNPAYLMQRAEGVSLQRLLREKMFAASKRLPIARALARALSMLHSAQIIHADPHPDNYFVCERPTGFTVIVLDIDGGGLLSPPGPIYPMSQPKRLYKAPELSQMKWEQLYRRRLFFAPDDWALAVFVYQLLVDYEGPFCTVQTHPNPLVKNYTPFPTAAYREPSIRWPMPWQEALLRHAMLSDSVISLFYETFARRFLLNEKTGEIKRTRPTAYQWEEALGSPPALPCVRHIPALAPKISPLLPEGRISVVMPVKSAPPPVTVHTAVSQGPGEQHVVGEPVLPPTDPIAAPLYVEDTVRERAEKKDRVGQPPVRGAFGWRKAMTVIVRKLHLGRGVSGNGQNAKKAAA